MQNGAQPKDQPRLILGGPPWGARFAPLFWLGVGIAIRLCVESPPEEDSDSAVSLLLRVIVLLVLWTAVRRRKAWLDTGRQELVRARGILWPFLRRRTPLPPHARVTVVPSVRGWLLRRAVHAVRLVGPGVDSIDLLTPFRKDLAEFWAQRIARYLDCELDASAGAAEPPRMSEGASRALMRADTSSDVDAWVLDRLIRLVARVGGSPGRPRQADGTVALQVDLPRPLLRQSVVFSNFSTLLVLSWISGLLPWVLGGNAWEFWRMAISVLHLYLVHALQFVLLAMLVGHIGTQFDARRQGQLLLGLTGVLVFFLTTITVSGAIQIAPWWHFWLLPLLLWLVAYLPFRKIATAANLRSIVSGALATALLFWIFVFADFFHYTARDHQFPEQYAFFPRLHVWGTLLACTAFVVHALLAPRRVAGAGASRKRRFVWAMSLGTAAATFCAGYVLVVGQHLKPAPWVAESTFPVVYDTSKVALGKAMSPDPRLVFEDSKTCGTARCHDSIYRQWSVSTHRYAGLIRTYQKAVTQVHDEVGPEATLLCAKCHTPVLAMLGIADDPRDKRLDPLRAQGIPCLYCHSIDRVGAARANGEFVVQVRSGPLTGHRPADADGVKSKEDYILRSLASHRQSMPTIDTPGKSEYCVGCHRVDMAHVSFGSSKLVLGDLQTPHDQSEAAAEGIGCWHCHMQLATYSTKNWLKTAHARPDHRMLGTNMVMPSLVTEPAYLEPHLEELGEATNDYLQGTYRIPDFERTYLKRMGHKLGEAYERYIQGARMMAVGVSAPQRAASGAAFTVQVAVVNKTGAHPFPSGPVNYSEYWIELTVTSADGKPLYSSGVLDAQRHLPVGTVTFGGTWYDKEGKRIDRYRFWAKHELRDKRSIPPGGSLTLPFDIALPPQARGPVTIRAALCYRRVDQDFADWAYDGAGTTFPVYRFATGEAKVEVASPVLPPR